MTAVPAIPAATWPPGLHYYPRLVPEAEADVCLAALLREVPWAERTIQIYGRTVLQPRLVALLGDSPNLAYTYSRTTIVPQPWTPTVAALKHQAETVAATPFNICLLNLYRDGRDSMGWHSDAEAELGPRPVIASWSFGVTRAFDLRRRDQPKEKIRLGLGHGDLLVMAGDLQRDWEHSVPRRARVDGARVNLTFRYLHPATAR